jgi:hypothetical protein
MHIQAMYSKEVPPPPPLPPLLVLCPLPPLQISASISVIDPRKNHNSKSGPGAVAGAGAVAVGRIDSIANDAAEVMTSGNYRSLSLSLPPSLPPPDDPLVQARFLLLRH